MLVLIKSGAKVQRNFDICKGKEKKRGGVL